METKDGMISLSDRLKRIDQFSSAETGLRVHTIQGAFISIFTLIAILFLIVTEVLYNFRVVLTETVDLHQKSSRENIEIEFDVTLERIPCHHLQVWAEDGNGELQHMRMDQRHNIWMHRIRVSQKDGGIVLLGNKSHLEAGSSLHMEESLVDFVQPVNDELLGNTTLPDIDFSSDEYCGDCYGAGEEGECCNSCDDVQRVMKRKMWPFHFLKYDQCTRVMHHELQELDGEGCNIHGLVSLSTAGGNLHIQPGKDPILPTVTPPKQRVDAMSKRNSQRVWNLSHVINKMAFGMDYPNAVSQLNGESRDPSRENLERNVVYQYYFQLIPTTFEFLNGSTVDTYQYSVTEHLKLDKQLRRKRHNGRKVVELRPVNSVEVENDMKTLETGDEGPRSGVYLFYEVSSLEVKVQQRYQKGWVPFFTSLSAVIGGVVTIMSMVDQFIFRSYRANDTLAS